MTTNEQPRGSYPYPENYLPAGYRCVRVYIPDDDIYQQDFMAGYEYFCTWLAWGRDPQRKGKAIAAKWRIGFDRVLDEISKGINCMTTFTNLRQNPANPCQLQYSADGGGTWQTFADISQCVSGSTVAGAAGITDLQIINNVIVGTDKCGDTVPLGPASDPRYNAAFKPPYDPAIAGNNCVAGANAAVWLEDRLHAWAHIRLNVIGYVQQVINIVQGLTVFFPEVIWTEGIWEIYDEIAEWSEDWWTNIETLAVYNDLRVILAKYYDGSGVMSKTQHAEMMTELATHYDGPPTTTFTKSAWFIIAFLANQLGSVGMTRISTAGGITSADCSDVEWEQVFDLHASSQGWLGDNGCQWITGVGFVDRLVEIAGINWRSAGVERTIPATTITYFRAEYDCELGSTNQSDGNRGQLFFNGEENPTLIEQDDNAEGPTVLIWQGSTANVTFLNATKNVSAVAVPADGGGTATISKVIVRGIGTNPFI